MNSNVQTIQQRLEAAAHTEAKNEADTVVSKFVKETGSDILYAIKYYDEGKNLRNGFAIMEDLRLRLTERRYREILDKKVATFVTDFEELRLRIEELERQINQ